MHQTTGGTLSTFLSQIDFDDGKIGEYKHLDYDIDDMMRKWELAGLNALSVTKDSPF